MAVIINASTTSGLQLTSDTSGAITLQNNGADAVNIGASGQLGIGGANYGTSGQVLTSNGSSAAPSWQAGVTTSSVLTATSGASIGAVGSYAFLSTGGASVTYGATVAGSSLQYGGIGGSTGTSNNGGIVYGNGINPSGTWRAMGSVNNETCGGTMFLRIA